MYSNIKIAVIGLGYVGLPLALELSDHFETIGYDTSTQRIHDLKKGLDKTGEIDKKSISKLQKINLTTSSNDLANCNFYIVTVPTPVDPQKKPDFEPLIKASKTVGLYLKQDDIVVYESTVYPGATEEICIPVLERISGLTINLDFFCGYSPERINPGDKNKSLKDIQKIISGSNSDALKKIDFIYSKIIKAGTYKVSSIKIAEAAKIIENTQRDLNIALINELAIIFNKLEIDTETVLKAAETKWNFISFRPGLVGGHCIGVDPYYLTHKSISLGYNPEIILAGRKLNDEMPQYIASQLIKKMTSRSINPVNSKLLIMGITFKENCPDIRNSKNFDLYLDLIKYNCLVDVYDPIANPEETKQAYGITLINSIEKNKYDAIIIAVKHNEFIQMPIEKIRSFCKSQKSIIYDLKYCLKPDESDIRL